MRLILIVIMIVCCFRNNLSAQDLEKIGRKDMIRINGGIQWTAVGYQAFNMIQRRDPFIWYFNGNLNITLLDISLPFTYSYSNNHSQFTQPFNMQSFHPKYKWIQGHAGTLSLNFSPYTLNGHTFTGGAMEIKPNGFYLGVMYGRLLKATPYNPDNNSNPPTFRRMGYAVKTGFEKGINSITVAIFHAKDDPSSVQMIPAQMSIMPMENTSVSFSGKTSIAQKINIDAEYAVSGLTRNIYSEIETTSFSGLSKFLLTTRMSTSFYKAWKASVGYKFKRGAMQLNHEHIDPGFTTLGAYYFNSDLESWTVAPSFHTVNGKFSVSLNTGFQRNNLDHSKLTTTRRWVNALQINFNPFQKLTTTFAYSNFTSVTNQKLRPDPFFQPSPADTLFYYQLSEQANAGVMYQVGKKIKHSISLMTSMQKTRQLQPGVTAPETVIINTNLSYAPQFTKTRATLQFLLNGNQSIADTLTTTQYGPGFQMTKGLLGNTLRLSAGSVYNRSMLNQQLQSHVWNHRFMLGWSPKVAKPELGKPSLSLSAVYIHKLRVTANTSNTGELTVNFNLAYQF